MMKTVASETTATMTQSFDNLQMARIGFFSIALNRDMRVAIEEADAFIKRMRGTWGLVSPIGNRRPD